MVTIPAVPPNSSSTMARWDFRRFMSARTSSTSRLPGTNSGSRMICPTRVSGWSTRRARICLAWTTPTTSSIEPRITGYRERPAWATRTAASRTVRSSGRATASVRGVMTSRAVFSVNSKTPSMSCTSPRAMRPDFWLCSRSITISSGEWTRSSSAAGLLIPSIRTTALALQLSSRVAGRVTQEKTRRGPATHRLTCSG